VIKKEKERKDGSVDLFKILQLFWTEQNKQMI